MMQMLLACLFRLVMFKVRILLATCCILATLGCDSHSDQKSVAVTQECEIDAAESIPETNAMGCESFVNQDMEDQIQRDSLQTRGNDLGGADVGAVSDGGNRSAGISQSDGPMFHSEMPMSDHSWDLTIIPISNPSPETRSLFHVWMIHRSTGEIHEYLMIGEVGEQLRFLTKMDTPGALEIPPEPRLLWHGCTESEQDFEYVVDSVIFVDLETRERIVVPYEVWQGDTRERQMLSRFIEYYDSKERE